MKKNWLLILLFPLAFIQSSHAQSYNSIIFDKNLTSYSGSENIITLNNWIYHLEGKYLKPRFNSESTIKNKGLGIGYRALKNLLIDYPAMQLLWIIQHEFFGHGYKAREYNFSNVRYVIAFPFPYGKGNGHTKFGQNLLKMSSHEKSAFFYSGSQATSLLANSLSLKFVKNRTINYREAMLYLFTFSDLTKYILSTNYTTASSGNDIVNYAEVTFDENSTKSELNKLKDKVMVNFLSPFPYMALYTFFKTYFWDGNSKNSLPMIPFSKFDYLPAFRFGLSPFGYEIYFGNYFYTSNNVINVYFRYGEPGININWGSGIYLSNIFRTSYFVFDGNLDFWKQPSLSLDDSKDVDPDAASYGYSALLTMYLSPFQNKNVNLLAQIGYKSKGFLEGENLSEDIILRAGLSFIK